MRSTLLIAVSVLTITGCSSKKDTSSDDAESIDSQIVIDVGKTDFTVNTDGTNTSGQTTLDGGVATEFGAYELGPSLSSSGDAGSSAVLSNTGNCGTVLTGIARDFQDYDQTNGDSDFNNMNCGLTTGMVENTLGANNKPVLNGTPSCIPGGAASFNQWYTDVPGTNLPYLIQIELVANAGIYTFSSQNYFPLDGAGFDPTLNAADDVGPACTLQSQCSGFPATQSCAFGSCWEHNFGFTTEWHTAFVYNGGEQFTFIGDDDVWVFINKKLAVDLGGVHGAATGAVTLDTSAATLGLTKGQSYPLDIFQAERHKSKSTFRIDTTLTFTDCGGSVIPTVN